MSASTRELLDACVHCGFCLPACPTYTLWGEEMDSPRGRIHLMSLVEDGELALDSSVARHLDRCLGCLACVPACPWAGGRGPYAAPPTPFRPSSGAIP